MRRVWRYLADHPDPDWVIFILYSAGIGVFVGGVIVALSLGWQP